MRIISEPLSRLPPYSVYKADENKVWLRNSKGFTNLLPPLMPKLRNEQRLPALKLQQASLPTLKLRQASLPTQMLRRGRPTDANASRRLQSTISTPTYTNPGL